MRLQPKGAAAKDSVLLAGDKIVSVSGVIFLPFLLSILHSNDMSFMALKIKNQIIWTLC